MRSIGANSAQLWLKDSNSSKIILSLGSMREAEKKNEDVTARIFTLTQTKNPNKKEQKHLKNDQKSALNRKKLINSFLKKDEKIAITFIKTKPDLLKNRPISCFLSWSSSSTIFVLLLLLLLEIILVAISAWKLTLLKQLEERKKSVSVWRVFANLDDITTLIKEIIKNSSWNCVMCFSSSL